MSDEFLLVTDFDLANRTCPACGHPPTDHGIVAGVCGSCDEATDCPNTRSSAARAWLDGIVRREAGKALREAAHDLPGFPSIATHGDAAAWLRGRATRIESGGQP